jgi:hypothetical protein
MLDFSNITVTFKQEGEVSVVVRWPDVFQLDCFKTDNTAILLLSLNKKQLVKQSLYSKTNASVSDTLPLPKTQWNVDFYSYHTWRGARETVYSSSDNNWELHSAQWLDIGIICVLNVQFDDGVISYDERLNERGKFMER